jgi:hypothetical protein
MKRTGFFWMSALLVLATACAAPTPAPTAVPPTATELPASATPTRQPTETPTPQPETRSDAALAQEITTAFNEVNPLPLTDILIVPPKEGFPADFVMGFASQDPSLDFSQNPDAITPEKANHIALNTGRDLYNSAIGTQYTSEEFLAHIQAGDIKPVQFMIGGEQVEMDLSKGMVLVAGTPDQPGRIEYQMRKSTGYKTTSTIDIQVIDGRVHFITSGTANILSGDLNNIGLKTAGVSNRFYDTFDHFAFAPLWLEHVLDVQQEKGEMQDILGPDWQKIRFTPGSWADGFSSGAWTSENILTTYEKIVADTSQDKYADKVPAFILEYNPSPQGRHTGPNSADHTQMLDKPHTTLHSSHIM